eukprot:2566371-Lingulodinium_polyedra.AAC.1
MLGQASGRTGLKEPDGQGIGEGATVGNEEVERRCRAGGHNLNILRLKEYKPPQLPAQRPFCK